MTFGLPDVFPHNGDLPQNITLETIADQLKNYGNQLKLPLSLLGHDLFPT